MKTILCVYIFYFRLRFGYEVHKISFLRGELNRMISMSHNVQYFLLSQHTFRSLRKFAKKPLLIRLFIYTAIELSAVVDYYLRWKNVCFYRKIDSLVEGEIYPFRDNLNYEFCGKKTK